MKSWFLFCLWTLLSIHSVFCKQATTLHLQNGDYCFEIKDFSPKKQALVHFQLGKTSMLFKRQYKKKLLHLYRFKCSHPAFTDYQYFGIFSEQGQTFIGFIQTLNSMHGPIMDQTEFFPVATSKKGRITLQRKYSPETKGYVYPEA